GLVVASLLNFTYAGAGQRIATVKSAPFAVSRSDFQKSRDMLRENGPVLQARPVRGATIAVLYTDPHNPERAKTLFEPIVRQKLERFGIRGHMNLYALENDDHLARAMQRLLMSRPAALLVASTTAPAGPCDAVGVAMGKIGCKIERFLAPVEPGNLLLM